jgi:hypothetical protein
VERGAEVIVDRTLVHLEPSIGVLPMLGFAPSKAPAGVLEFSCAAL